MMPEFKNPDQIEREVIAYYAQFSENSENPVETAIEAIAMFRRGLSKNGYVFYQP